MEVVSDPPSIPILAFRLISAECAKMFCFCSDITHLYIFKFLVKPFQLSLDLKIEPEPK